ncbi:acyl-CoA dehydrogenase C-terminal domain-containing protein [Desulfosporosinus meridiei]|uniref:acyl-CoA dehydrogenase C-terminal domain-containing protein n=1 Tax=Desulfosporosinus meridiei TaxID=79209 RepID=UPI00249EA534|nr:acyl-CoA dehydrogenase C-terminal domain-containing protein [Desulfosporosinus meridiei]
MNKDNEALSKEFANLGKALNAYQDMLKALAGYSKTNMSMIPLYSRRILTATAQLFCGRQILDQAILADKKSQRSGI